MHKKVLYLYPLASVIGEEEAALHVVLKDLENGGILVKTEKGSYVLCREPQYIDILLFVESVKEKVRDIDQEQSFIDTVSASFLTPDGETTEKDQSKNNIENGEKTKNSQSSYSVVIQKLLKYKSDNIFNKLEEQRQILHVLHLLEHFQHQQASNSKPSYKNESKKSKVKHRIWTQQKIYLPPQLLLS